MEERAEAAEAEAKELEALHDEKEGNGSILIFCIRVYITIIYRAMYGTLMLNSSLV